MSGGVIFPDNRFTALDEFLKLLGFNRYEWQSLFKVLSKADSGFLEFCIGDVTIEAFVGSGDSIGEGEGDWMRIIFRVFKDNVEKSAIYSFEMRELKALGEEKKLKIESFKG